MHTRRAILDALATGPHSGPALAERLDISRAAVWKQIEALRDRGFEIASTDDGYTLETVPSYGGDAVALGLDAPFEVRYQETVESTNASARALAAEGHDDLVVLADRQTGGKGRLDRAWDSPSGGIWASLLLSPTVPPTAVPVYTLAAAVAIVDGVGEIDGVDARIKWPNDVLVGADGQKLAGILTEMEGEADRVSWLVIGMGINANVPPAALPDGATSLQAEAGPVDRRAVTQRVLEGFDRLRASDEAEILAAWRERADTLGRVVRVQTPGETITGTAVDIEPPGTLVVETDAGQRRVTAGDCEHLRPA